MFRPPVLSVILAFIALFLLAGLAGLPVFREILLALGLLTAGVLLFLLLGLAVALLLVALALPLYHYFKPKTKPGEEQGDYTLQQVKP